MQISARGKSVLWGRIERIWPQSVFNYALALSANGKLSSPFLPESNSNCSWPLRAVTRPRYVFRWVDALSNASCALPRLVPRLNVGFNALGLSFHHAHKLVTSFFNFRFIAAFE